MLRLKLQNVLCSKLLMLLILVPLSNINSKDLLSTKKIKDYGKRGHTFAIAEKSLLTVITEKLKAAERDGKIKDLQEKFQNKVKQKISRPIAIQNVHHTVVSKQRIFDPTYTQKEDIRNHLDQIIVKKGTKVNPLDYLNWGEPLLFIDGDESSHINWALKQQGQIILIKGAPLELEEKYNHLFYFDQGGILVKKFQITQVPAKITQDGKMLKVEEVKL